MYKEVELLSTEFYTPEEYAGFALVCDQTSLSTVRHDTKEPKPQNVIDAATILDELNK